MPQQTIKPTPNTPAVERRQRRQALVIAIMWGVPIVVLELLGPVLQSNQSGAHVWWRVLQGLLTGMMILSPAGGPILATGLLAMVQRSPSIASLVTLVATAMFVLSVIAIFLPSLSTNLFAAVAVLLVIVQIVRLVGTPKTRTCPGDS